MTPYDWDKSNAFSNMDRRRGVWTTILPGTAEDSSCNGGQYCTYRDKERER